MATACRVHQHKMKYFEVYIIGAVGIWYTAEVLSILENVTQMVVP